ncbi:MAG: autotransporter-associated beta strand repeat-containing protein, partial [Chitinivibrionales bacterium]
MTVSTKKKLPGASLLYAATIVAFVFVNCGFATTYIKANNQTNLNTSGSWTIAGYPGSGDIGKWDNTVTATYGTISLGGDMTWAGLVIANPGGWITFNAGNTLTLGASGIDMSASTQSATISCNVALNADQTWTIAPTPALYLNGIISGAHSLTKSGAGTLFLLNVANTYSGGTTVNTGTLQVGNGGGAPGEENAAALGTGTVTVNNGTTLWFKPAGNSNVYNFANSFVLNGGTIIGEDGIQHLATGGATLGIGSGGTVEATWWGKDVYIDGLVSGSTNLAIAHGPTASNSSAIVHITNPANTFSGTVTVTPQASGVDMYLDLDNITALQSATVNLAAGTGGTSYLQLGTTNATTIIAGLTGAATVCKVQPFTSAGTYTLNVNNAVSDSFAGILQNNTTGILALTKTGAGTLTLSGNDTNSGLITVNAGKLRLTGTQRSNAVKYVINSGGIISVPDRLNLSPIPAGYTADWVTINGGTFSTGGNGYSANRGFTLGASGGTIEIPNIDNSNVVQISSVIAGTGALTKTGVGTLNLNVVNTYSGNTTISAGTLQLGAANVIPNGANKGDVSVAGTLDLNTFS